jgi:hypothetical protein
MTPEDRARLVLRRHAKRKLAGHAGSRLSSYDDTKPYCDNPQRVVQRHDTRKGGALAGIIPSLETAGWFPCRKCDKCILFRRLRWRDRIRREIAFAPRSWMVTLTFSDLHLSGIRLQAAADRSKPFETALERACYKHVQRYLKRVRKMGKCQFRYVGIFELGAQTGRGHYHLIVSEVHRSNPVLKRVLNDQWRSFVEAHLVSGGDGDPASYVSKYLTKSAVTRPRASRRYGEPAPAPIGQAPPRKTGGQGGG